MQLRMMDEGTRNEVGLTTKSKNTASMDVEGMLNLGGTKLRGTFHEKGILRYCGLKSE